MDGLWNNEVGVEGTNQGELSKHRLLRVNLSTNGLTNPGDASSGAALNPNTTASTELVGPHFHMSPVTPDNRPTLGFEFALLVGGLGLTERMTFPAGGVNVTIWSLIGHLASGDGGIGNRGWVSFATLSGVQAAQLFHSFDINAGCIRFQISGTADDTLATNSVLIAFSEL